MSVIFLRQAMLRALWLQAVSVTRECRRFADVFQSEELFDHALHTQTETAMRRQTVFVHSQVVFKSAGSIWRFFILATCCS